MAFSTGPVLSYERGPPLPDVELLLTRGDTSQGIMYININ